VAASPGKSMLGITSTTAIRPQIYYIGIGCHDTPADNSLQWFIQRSTAAGTNTAVTPVAQDPGDPVSTAGGTSNHTVEPTYTSATVLWRMPLNQRASHSLYLEPDSALVAPATANNGLGLYVIHASFVGAVSGTLFFQE